MKKIVVAEDDCLLREELVSILQKAQYKVTCIEEFHSTVREIVRISPDMLLLDINLPGVTGFEICKSLRQSCNVPILVLTSRDQMRDELHALSLGADDYLTKPCSKERLLARIASLLRRWEGRNNFVEINGIQLDRQTYTMYMDNRSVVLPENQGRIMEQLMLHFGETVTKGMLHDALWGTSIYIDENALQVNMTRLKKNLSTLGMEIKIITVRGEGYCLLA